MVGNIGRGTGDADTVSLLDLQKEPWRIVDTVSVGQTPEGIQTSPDGRFAAVAIGWDEAEAQRLMDGVEAAMRA